MSSKMKQSDLETNNQIPYKYIDADNKVYKEPPIKNDKGEISSDITPDQSVISKQSKKQKEINIENIENLSEDEIRNLIDEKIGAIQQLGKKTSNLQKKLKSALKQLNDKIQESAELLYKKESNPTELQWLQEQLKTKQNLLTTEKKMNHSYKVQYKILENKLKNRDIIKTTKKSLENDTSNTNATKNINKTLSAKTLSINKSVTVSNSLYMSLEDEILLIKEKNKELIAEIAKIKEKKVSQKKEVDDILNGELELQLKQKMEEFQQFTMMKMDSEDKYNTLNKSMTIVKEKIKHFEEKAKMLEGKEDMIQTDKLENYNFWMDLIKNEINNNTQEELINLIKNDKSEFLKEINKSRKTKKKKKFVKDASTETIKENNFVDDKKLNQNKNIYAIFSLLNNMINKNNDNKNINENPANENMQLEKLLKDENIYNSLTENQYRELLSKKEEYVETSIRLEKTIQSFVKTENTKYARISKAIKEKLVQLKLVKEKNKLIQDEVKNLDNIYQLSLEKEKIKKEINKKMIIKINKKIPQKIEEKNIQDKNYINVETNKKVEKKESKLKQNIPTENKNKEDDFPDTRDEQLKMIKKKYMEEDNEENKNINNENNDKDVIQNIDENGNELNIDDLNEENKQFEQKEIKPGQQMPFKV